MDKRLDSINYSHILVLNFGDSPGKDIDSRRYRISAIHNVAKQYVNVNSNGNSNGNNYVFSIEDDTVYPYDALTKMLTIFEDYQEYSQCGFVQGVQVGRHNTPYIGAWQADDTNRPKRITSAMPDVTKAQIEEIDAGGLYCCLFRAEDYMQHHFEPYDKQGTNGLSCDVNFGLWLRNKGYKCYMDWSIECDHIGERGSVNLGNTTPKQVMFTKNTKGWHGETL